MHLSLKKSVSISSFDDFERSRFRGNSGFLVGYGGRAGSASRPKDYGARLLAEASKNFPVKY